MKNHRPLGCNARNAQPWPCGRSGSRLPIGECHALPFRELFHRVACDVVCGRSYRRQLGNALQGCQEFRRCGEERPRSDRHTRCHRRAIGISDDVHQAVPPNVEAPRAGIAGLQSIARSFHADALCNDATASPRPQSTLAAVAKVRANSGHSMHPVASSKNLTETCFVASRKNLTEII